MEGVVSAFCINRGGCEIHLSSHSTATYCLLVSLFCCLRISLSFLSSLVNVLFPVFVRKEGKKERVEFLPLGANRNWFVRSAVRAAVFNLFAFRVLVCYKEELLWSLRLEVRRGFEVRRRYTKVCQDDAPEDGVY